MARLESLFMCSVLGFLAVFLKKLGVHVAWKLSFRVIGSEAAIQKVQQKV